MFSRGGILNKWIVRRSDATPSKFGAEFLSILSEEIVAPARPRHTSLTTLFVVQSTNLMIVPFDEELIS